MQKLLISLCCLSTLQLTACSSSTERENAPTTSFLESIPIVYRTDIQQGNIINQEMVDKLQPGMSKRQVRFVLGTPMLVDVFHLNRWDYQYANTQGWGKTERKRLTLYFQNDSLIRLEGDFRPTPGIVDKTAVKETVVSVPDYQDPDKGIIGHAVDAVESIWTDDPASPESPGEQAMQEAAQAKQEMRKEPALPAQDDPAGAQVQ